MEAEWWDIKQRKLESVGGLASGNMLVVVWGQVNCLNINKHQQGQGPWGQCFVTPVWHPTTPSHSPVSVLLTLLPDPRHRRQTATTIAAVTAGILVLGQPPTLHFNWLEHGAWRWMWVYLSCYCMLLVTAEMLDGAEAGTDWWLAPGTGLVWRGRGYRRPPPRQPGTLTYLTGLCECCIHSSLILIWHKENGK